MGLLVASGFGIGALYYSYKEPRVRAQIQRELDAAPTTEEGRLDHWILFGAAQVHHRLSVVARISEDQPWLVTHAVTPDGDGPPEVYGIDVSDLPRDLVQREGMAAVLSLPAPTLLGRAELQGDNARHVPRYASGTEVPDPVARLEDLVDWFLKDLAKALKGDIETASLTARIAGRSETFRIGG